MRFSPDGKYVVVYGAGYTIELFDSESLEFVKMIDIDADMTTAIVRVVATPGKTVASR